MALSIVGVGSDGQTTWQVTTVTTVKQSVDCLSKISANQNITDQLLFDHMTHCLWLLLCSVT